MGLRISVVIPNWNGAARLAALLESLDQQTERAYEVWVVDNASSDQSQQAAHARGAAWIPLDRNYGFARAVNTGVQQAVGDAIAIVNNDIVLAPDFLERLGSALETHAFVAPKILMASDPTWLDGAFDLTSRGFCSLRAGNGFPASGFVWNRPRAIASAPMTAAIFRRTVFETVGLLDEQFESYLEDIDFGIRCALKHVTGYYEPAAVAWHEGSATFGGAWNARSVRLIARNQVLLARKYGSIRSWRVFVGQTLWGLAALKNGTGAAWIQGKIEGSRLKVDPLESGSAVRNLLREQEQEITALLAGSATSQLYWSLYLTLSGSRL